MNNIENSIHIKIIKILNGKKNRSMDQFGLALSLIKDTTLNIRDGYMAIGDAQRNGVIEFNTTSSVATMVKLSQKYFQ